MEARTHLRDPSRRRCHRRNHRHDRLPGQRRTELPPGHACHASRQRADRADRVGAELEVPQCEQACRSWWEAYRGVDWVQVYSVIGRGDKWVASFCCRRGSVGFGGEAEEEGRQFDLEDKHSSHAKVYAFFEV